jgi:hypothetical protein
VLRTAGAAHGRSSPPRIVPAKPSSRHRGRASAQGTRIVDVGTYEARLGANPAVDAKAGHLSHKLDACRSIGGIERLERLFAARERVVEG